MDRFQDPHDPKTQGSRAQDSKAQDRNAALARSLQGFLLRPGLWFLLWMALEGFLVVLLAQQWGLATVILAAIAKSALGLIGLVWLTGRSLLKVSAPGFRLVQLEKLGTGMLLALTMMVPGFVLSLLGLALLAPGLRQALLRRATPPRDDVIDLEPGQWREIEPRAPRLPGDTPNRP